MDHIINDISLSKDDLHRVQAILLELLCEVRRICKLADIHYTIIAGTLLGAVRHGGFIPWDDDADVAFFREDYEAFRTACGKHLNTSRYYFQDHTNTEGYRWGYGKLRRRGSRYVVQGTEHMPYEQGIWIDVFPLDSIPEHWFGRVACNAHCFCIRKLLYAESGKYRERSTLKRGIYALLSRVPLKAVLRHYERYVVFRRKSQTNWVRILMFPTPNQAYGYRRNWYENTVDISFAGEIFSGIQNFDAYLTFKFGRYMELPPPEKRKQHWVSELSFPEEMEDAI